MSRIAGTGSTNRIFQGQKKDFIVMRKDTFEYTGTYTYADDEGNEYEYDFTNCIGQMAIKKKKTDTTAVRIVSVSFDAEEYTLYVEADNMDMDAGKYYYDLQIYDADNKMVTKLYGDFIVLQDVTDFLDIIEEEYEYLLNSSVAIDDISKDNFSLIIMNSVLTELITNVKEYNITILGSTITTHEVFKYTMALVFNSNATVTIIPRYTTVVMLNSNITNTTYINEYYYTMLYSSVTGIVLTTA